MYASKAIFRKILRESELLYMPWIRYTSLLVVYIASKSAYGLEPIDISGNTHTYESSLDKSSISVNTDRVYMDKGTSDPITPCLIL